MAHPAIPAVLMFFGTTGPAKIPLSMLVIFVAAKLMAELAERVGQPGIVGEILAGVLIGPSVLGWLAPNEFLSALSDLGAMFLLFRVGLEVKSSELMKVGGIATLVACSGVVVPFVMGMAILLLWGAPTTKPFSWGRPWSLLVWVSPPKCYRPRDCCTPSRANRPGCGGDRRCPWSVGSGCR